MTDDQALRRGLFLVGEYDLSGGSSAAIMAVPVNAGTPPSPVRLLTLLGVLGTLVGKDRDGDAVTPGDVTVTIKPLP